MKTSNSSTFTNPMVKSLTQKVGEKNKPTRMQNTKRAVDTRRHQGEKIAQLRNHLQLADTGVGATIAEKLLCESDGNVVRAKMIMQRHVTIAKLLSPNKSIEKIILDYQEEKKCESNGNNIKNTTDAETERKTVPGSILYMRLNYLQPKLQK
mmetsp:Transcript_3889/g.5981  ORF Transcript_3889/g.5981 Transcript_3889/m.5981 type:complete len:152 (-) Transcript_3889:239-694(-)